MYKYAMVAKNYPIYLPPKVSGEWVENARRWQGRLVTVKPYTSTSSTVTDIFNEDEHTTLLDMELIPVPEYYYHEVDKMILTLDKLRRLL